ncbi:APC family permease [Vulcanococcus limneticus]|uniref:APC family permease n=1 Tax=Vulcanococcus limneticus TaxID=2170428 RepID=UPI00398BD1F8
MTGPQEPAPRAGLLHILGLGFGLAGAVGGSIGAGILRTPGLVAAQLGSPVLILAAWLLGGVYALLGAMCVAELGASLPRAGGWYVYAQRAFGPWAGFSVGWTDWLGHVVGLAWVAITVGDYVEALLPAFPVGPKATACLVLAVFSLIQLLGVRAGSASQQLLSLVKAVAFLALVLACFLLGDQAGGEAVAALGAAAEASPDLVASTGLATGSITGPGFALAAVLAMQAVITTYDGWASPIYFSEEFSEPARDLPRSLLGGVVAVLLIYLLVNGALLRVLPLEQLAASALPAADAARRLVGPLGGHLITGLALLSLLGLVNTVVMAAPRILFGLSRDGLVPAFAQQVTGGGTPLAALAITSGGAAALVLSGSFARLLGMASFLYVAIYLAGIVALLVLRWREPELERPFRAWGYPFTPLLIAAGSLAFLVAALCSDTANSLAALALIALGYPLYAASRRLGWGET